MAIYRIIIEEIEDKDTLAGQILLWVLFGWWLVPFLFFMKYTFYFIFVFPFKLLINGVQERSVLKILFGLILCGLLGLAIYYGNTNP
ncbi:hypothetical protein JN09_001142 [Acholeplasma morum]|uniref:hypothetical protein n=1 Tax=Paracholeplasma morum TaxID=264637 RepID=UPI00195B3868|nr:hypothetical protein [Paracholeplasma morum]MBM7453809.1 hypothetical protein [Paracholeplasma morum]